MKIILYDGDCMLCNSFIAFVLKQQNPAIFFCDLNTGKGRQILMDYNLPVDQLSTIYFLDNEIIYDRSSAIIKIFRNFNKYYVALAVIMSLIPTGFRDIIYNVIAKNRRRFFKKNYCFLPNETQRKQILY